MDCVAINRATNGQPNRVAQIDAVAPDCACESHPMSEYSPGPVTDYETLVRFVSSPLFYDKKKGRLKPNLFSHVATKGCSIVRELHATDSNVSEFVRNLAIRDQEWIGVVTATCKGIRAIRIADTERRPLCIYDMALPNNPAHAEICQTSAVAFDGDSNELRAHLMRCFGGGLVEAPEAYRAGVILDHITDKPRDES